MEKNKKDAETILVIATGFLILHIVLEIKLLLWIALGISILYLVFPSLGKKIVWLWGKIGEILGWINTRILLTIVFFIFLMPVAFIAKLFSKDKLQLKKKIGSNTSYYIERNHQYQKKDLENVW